MADGHVVVRAAVHLHVNVFDAKQLQESKIMNLIEDMGWVPSSFTNLTDLFDARMSHNSVAIFTALGEHSSVAVFAEEVLGIKFLCIFMFSSGNLIDCPVLEQLHVEDAPACLPDGVGNGQICLEHWHPHQGIAWQWNQQTNIKFNQLVNYCIPPTSHPLPIANEHQSSNGVQAARVTSHCGQPSNL
jgi:hypothetical protein